MITNSTWSKRRDRCEINENEPIMETNRQLVQFRIRRRHYIRSAAMKTDLHINSSQKKIYVPLCLLFLTQI